MKQTIIVTIILSTLWSCDNQTKKEASTKDQNGIENEMQTQDLDSTSTETGWNYKEVERKNIGSLLLNICSTSDLEFIDLYPTLDSIASDKYESLILVDSLKTKGFQVIEWGRGNWMEGPRIVSFTMSDQQCECQVDKLYYSIDQKGKYKVTERIKCKKTSR